MDYRRLPIANGTKEERAQAEHVEALHPRITPALACFYITNSVGLSRLPTIVRRIRDSHTQVILISGIPWLCAIPVMGLLRGTPTKPASADGIRYSTVRRRIALRWHCCRNNLVLAIAAFSAATLALYSFPSPFWALPTLFLSGPAAAASIALINATGNLGGFAGPYLIGYLADITGGYTAGLMYLISCGVIASGLILSLRTTRQELTEG
jgi:ACS family tartrate transporter-like MFS transporter